MRANPRAMLAYLLFLLLIALCLGATRGTHSAPDAMVAAATPHGTNTLPDLSGSWNGGWVDTVFGVPGPTVFTINIAGGSLTGGGFMNLSALGHGLGILEPFTLTGTITGSTLTFHYAFTNLSALTSSGDGTVTGTRSAMTGNGTVGAPLNFGSFTYTGDAGAQLIESRFTYGAGAGGGIFTMTKASAVDPESWGNVKSKYRAGG